MKKRINLELERPEESAAVFKALASPEHLMILQSLLEKPYSISELAEKFKLPTRHTPRLSGLHRGIRTASF